MQCKWCTTLIFLFLLKIFTRNDEASTHHPPLVCTMHISGMEGMWHSKTMTDKQFYPCHEALWRWARVSKECFQYNKCKFIGICQWRRRINLTAFVRGRNVLLDAGWNLPKRRSLPKMEIFTNYVNVFIFHQDLFTLLEFNIPNVLI